MDPFLVQFALRKIFGVRETFYFRAESTNQVFLYSRVLYWGRSSVNII